MMAQHSEPLERIQDDQSSSNLECPICLQTCVHPVELPCSHIFCYLCIKGVVIQGPNSRCAICRQSIPHNVLTHPRLKDISQLYKDQTTGSNYQWYYEARGGGWWMYDVRTMQELERAFDSKQQTCQVLIAGQVYEIDFTQMIQYRVNNRTLFRRIKRDLSTAEKRGVAGIRLNQGNGQNARSGSGPGGSASSRRRGSPQVPAPDNQRNQGGLSSVPNQLQEAAEDSGNSETDENEDDSPDCSEQEGDEEEDDDDDMDLGEEEEDVDDAGSGGVDDEDEGRDGARAPTRRSDRSNSSSNNQTSPPSTPSGSGPNNGSVNCSSSAPDKQNCVRDGEASFVQHNAEWKRQTSNPKRSTEHKQDDGSRRRNSRSRQSATPSPSNHGANIQIGSIHLNSPINNNGSLTCIVIGPSLRITIDYNGSISPDEVL